MITGFDLQNAMHRSFGLAATHDAADPAPSLLRRVLARVRAASATVLSF